MDIEPLEILKWIGIVLAAGFIGYFGRYLAMFLIERLRRRKPGEPKSAPAPETGEARIEESRLKLEKKKAKQQVKQAKKAGRE